MLYILLYVVIGVLLAAVLTFYSKKKASGVLGDSDRQYQTALATYKRQLQKLDNELGAGQITQEEFENLSLEVKAEAISLQKSHQKQPKNASLALVCALLVVIPLVSVGGYLWEGAYDQVGVDDALAEWSEAIETGAPDANEKKLTLLTLLDSAVVANPDDERMLYLQAQLAKQDHQYKKAASIFKRLAEIAPEDPQVVAEYAQAEFFVNQGVMTPELLTRFEGVLQLDPDNRSTLALLAIYHYQEGRKEEAIKYWKRLRSLLAENEPSRGQIDEYIRMTEAELGMVAVQEDGVLINVSLPPGVTLTERARVFVVARLAAGGPPLAAKQIDPATLPRAVTLTDADAMLEGHNISSVDTYDVYAVLSYSGAPMPTSGDYRSASQTVTGEKTTFDVVIDQEVK